MGIDGKVQALIALGAGFDKNATMIKAMPQLGFGYTEIGTITPKPQYGNIKPRLFRYKEFESIQNAMGFNNKGADEVIKNLHKSTPYPVVVGASIGKNKTTPENLALEDYKILIKELKDVVDFFVVFHFYWVSADCQTQYAFQLGASSVIKTHQKKL